MQPVRTLATVTTVSNSYITVASAYASCLSRIGVQIARFYTAVDLIAWKLFFLASARRLSFLLLFAAVHCRNKRFGHLSEFSRFYSDPFYVTAAVTLRLLQGNSLRCLPYDRSVAFSNAISPQNAI